MLAIFVSACVALYESIELALAVFDLDPVGIRIARLIEGRAVPLESTGMTPELLFARARRRLSLNRWDEAQLERYAGDATAFEPLRAAIARGWREGRTRDDPATALRAD